MSDSPSSDAAPLQGKSMLVVEDEFLIQLDIQNILESAGAQSVVAASHVADALAAMDASEKAGKRFDAAVLDLRLDKESAVPVAERLARLNIPFVFLTGAPTDTSLAEDFKSTPVAGKPFDSATLLAALQQAMSRQP
jgi:CheY-like chemotaxis protein